MQGKAVETQKPPKEEPKATEGPNFTGVPSGGGPESRAEAEAEQRRAGEADDGPLGTAGPGRLPGGRPAEAPDWIGAARIGGSGHALCPCPECQATASGPRGPEGRPKTREGGASGAAGDRGGVRGAVNTQIIHRAVSTPGAARRAPRTCRGMPAGSRARRRGEQITILATTCTMSPRRPKQRGGGSEGSLLPSVCNCGGRASKGQARQAGLIGAVPGALAMQQSAEAGTEARPEESSD